MSVMELKVKHGNSELSDRSALSSERASSEISKKVPDVKNINK